MGLLDRFRNRRPRSLPEQPVLGTAPPGILVKQQQATPLVVATSTTDPPRDGNQDGDTHNDDDSDDDTCDKNNNNDIIVAGNADVCDDVHDGAEDEGVDVRADSVFTLKRHPKISASCTFDNSNTSNNTPGNRRHLNNLVDVPVRRCVSNVDLSVTRSEASDRRLSFVDDVEVAETFHKKVYQRKVTPRQRMSIDEIHQIRQELKDYKINEMAVHPESKHNTHIFKSCQ